MMAKSNKIFFFLGVISYMFNAYFTETEEYTRLRPKIQAF
jgi:hypothetical protein